MAERKYDLRVLVLALFVVLVPIFGAAGDKIAVTYASLFVALFSLGACMYTGRIIVTRTAIINLIFGAFSFLQLFYVSDKGNHAAFSTVFITSAAIAIVVSDLKKSCNKEKLFETVTKTVYVSSLVYAFCALFYQIFVEGSLLFGAMDLGKGSATASAVIVMMGILSGFILFHKKEKSLGYYPAMILLWFVFIMSGSIIAYLMAAILILVTLLNMKKRKLHGLLALVGVCVMGIANLICIIIKLITGSVEPGGAYRGLVSVVGIGKGGYNAIMAILDMKYHAAPPLFMELMEIFGVVGICMMILMIGGAYVLCARKLNVGTLWLFLSVVAVFCTSGNAWCYMMPLFSTVFALMDDGKELKTNALMSLVLIAPMGIAVLFTFGRIPYAIGKNFYDLGQFEKAEGYFSVSAACQLFNSEPYERAYLCEIKAHEEEAALIGDSEGYLEKAMKFNGKNYLYRAYLADIYSQKLEMEKALEIWDGIISRHDKESLYVDYAKKIHDTMKYADISLVRMEELYNKLLEYADKAEDPQIKLEVNNIATQSQQYYIEKREGKPDIFYIDETPEVLETPTDEAETEILE